MTTKQTRLAQSGLFPTGKVSVTNPPAFVTTTVVFPNADVLPTVTRESLVRSSGGLYENFYYGGVDTPNTVALARMIAEIEGSSSAVLTPSGQAAIVATASALLRPGDHVTVVDTVTYTTRWYFERLRNSGIFVDYYPPDANESISDYFRDNTRLVFMESPGSFTFEVQDVPAICREAAGRGVTTVLDNTWSASMLFDPFQHGVDVSIISLTKYHAAVAGVSLGAVVLGDPELHERIKTEVAILGMHVSPDVCARASVVLPTLSLRISHQEKAIQNVLARIQSRHDIKRLYHPSLGTCVGHAIWRRDFRGANSLFSMQIEPNDSKRMRAFVNAFKTIKIGYGWGGPTSLATAFQANEWRTASYTDANGLCLRIYVGCEDPGDVADDIEQALDASAPWSNHRQAGEDVVVREQ